MTSVWFRLNYDTNRTDVILLESYRLGKHTQPTDCSTGTSKVISTYCDPRQQPKPSNTRQSHGALGVFILRIMRSQRIGFVERKLAVAGYGRHSHNSCSSRRTVCQQSAVARFLLQPPPSRTLYPTTFNLHHLFLPFAGS